MERMRLANKAKAGNSDEYFSKNVKDYCRVLADHANSAQYIVRTVFFRVRAVEHKIFVENSIVLYFWSKRGTFAVEGACVTVTATLSVEILLSSSLEND